MLCNVGRYRTMNRLLEKLPVALNMRMKLMVLIILVTITVGFAYIFSQTSLHDDAVRPSNYKAKHRYEANANISRSFSHDALLEDTDNIKEEQMHILFLKVHKAASSTMQNIFYRFGLQRNLSFVLPIPWNYFSKEFNFFSDLLPPLPPPFCANRDDDVCEPNAYRKYDIMCNHMVFNKNKLNKLLHSDSAYVAIVREPFEQFVSAAYYYRNVWNFPYLKRLSNETFILDLIREPEKYEATQMIESKTFNSMTYDFGFKFSVETAENITDGEFDKFLNKTKDTFDIVLVKEKFDESLVLMKRMLKWTLRDILYIKNNEYMSKMNSSMPIPTLSTGDMNLFKKRNRFDYSLFELFRSRLNDQISKQQDIQAEVKHFRFLLKHVSDFCATKSWKKAQLTESLCKLESNLVRNSSISKTSRFNVTGSQNDSNVKCKSTKYLQILGETRKQKLKFSKSKWNEEFSINGEECEFMTMPELDILKFMKSRHKVLLNSRRRKHRVP